MSPRRPSTALVVSFVSLFVSLGGAGYAAVRLPANSVGSAQLRANSVGARKIASKAIGTRQVNSSQVQRRVSGPCTSGAIQSIASSGDVTCTQALPDEYGTSGATTTLVPTGAQVASESLPGGVAGATYLVIGNVRFKANGSDASGQSVDLNCTLQAGQDVGTGEAIPALDADGPVRAGAIPIVVPVSVGTSPETVTITCGYAASPRTPAPSVDATATINAIQTAANN